MSWGHILDKPSPISCIEPDFIVLSLRIPGFHAWLQGWQGDILEIKCNRATWHFGFATSAATIINRTAFCYDKRSLKCHLTGSSTDGSMDDSPPHCHRPWSRFLIDWIIARLWLPCCALLQAFTPLVHEMCTWATRKGMCLVCHCWGFLSSGSIWLCLLDPMLRSPSPEKWAQWEQRGCRIT